MAPNPHITVTQYGPNGQISTEDFDTRFDHSVVDYAQEGPNASIQSEMESDSTRAADSRTAPTAESGGAGTNESNSNQTARPTYTRRVRIERDHITGSGPEASGSQTLFPDKDSAPQRTSRGNASTGRSSGYHRPSAEFDEEDRLVGDSYRPRDYYRGSNLVPLNARYSRFSTGTTSTAPTSAYVPYGGPSSVAYPRAGTYRIRPQAGRPTSPPPPHQPSVSDEDERDDEDNDPFADFYPPSLGHYPQPYDPQYYPWQHHSPSLGHYPQPYDPQYYPWQHHSPSLGHYPQPHDLQYYPWQHHSPYSQPYMSAPHTGFMYGSGYAYPYPEAQPPPQERPAMPYGPSQNSEVLRLQAELKMLRKTLVEQEAKEESARLEVRIKRDAEIHMQEFHDAQSRARAEIGLAKDEAKRAARESIEADLKQEQERQRKYDSDLALQERDLRAKIRAEALAQQQTREMEITREQVLMKRAREQVMYEAELSRRKVADDELARAVLRNEIKAEIMTAAAQASPTNSISHVATSTEEWANTGKSAMDAKSQSTSIPYQDARSPTASSFKTDVRDGSVRERWPRSRARAANIPPPPHVPSAPGSRTQTTDSENQSIQDTGSYDEYLTNKSQYETPSNSEAENHGWGSHRWEEMQRAETASEETRQRFLDEIASRIWNALSSQPQPSPTLNVDAQTSRSSSKFKADSRRRYDSELMWDNDSVPDHDSYALDVKAIKDRKTETLSQIPDNLIAKTFEPPLYSHATTESKRDQLPWDASPSKTFDEASTLTTTTRVPLEPLDQAGLKVACNSPLPTAPRSLKSRAFKTSDTLANLITAKVTDLAKSSGRSEGQTLKDKEHEPPLQTKHVQNVKGRKQTVSRDRVVDEQQRNDSPRSDQHHMPAAAIPETIYDRGKLAENDMMVLIQRYMNSWQQPSDEQMEATNTVGDSHVSVTDASPGVNFAAQPQSWTCVLQ